jgi:hypothetical protein
VIHNKSVGDAGPNVLAYDYGHWTADGGRIVVSGRDPSGQPVVGVVNRDGGGAQVNPASALGLGWTQDAVQRPSGEIVMLASPGERGSPLAIYNSDGQAITGTIGGGAPSYVKWSPDRSAVFLIVGGRRYVARVDGTVSDITDQIGGVQAVGWVSGSLPPDAQVPQAFIPSGVIEGSQYAPGTQVILNGNLNMREGPSIGYRVIGGVTAGEYVAILAGPVEAGSVIWWRVRTAGGAEGWLAGTINGVSRFVP